ncbi:MAG: hypothetical protein ABEK50_03275 [bacterium]
MATLRSLHDYSLAELHELYRQGERPDPSELDGDFEGGVPAVSSESLLGKLSLPTYFLSKLNLLPWSGKSFSADTQRGHNRLLFSKFSLAPFEFRTDASREDGETCLVLDYGIEENSFLLNVIRDEVRQVKDDLILGQMYFKPTSSLVLYFALENNR